MCNTEPIRDEEEERLSLLDIVESMNDDVPRGEASHFPFSSNGDD